MNKSYSKAELEKKAQELLKNRSETTLFANARGEFFTSKNALQNSLKKGEASYEFFRADEKSDKTESGTNDEDEAIRAELVAKYKELYGKEPAKNSRNETISQRISEKEAELAANAGKESGEGTKEESDANGEETDKDQ
ncbi:MAG: hypothetical protein GX159_09890 [Flavobacteriaceae bacterium]|jgi:hypothetical protein|nr:hypothetical protein [Flavobacteriaceae bacterium]